MVGGQHIAGATFTAHCIAINDVTYRGQRLRCCNATTIANRFVARVHIAAQCEQQRVISKPPVQILE